MFNKLADIINGLSLTTFCRSDIYWEKHVDSGLQGGIGYWAGGSFADFDRDGRLDFFGPEWEAGYPSPPA